MSSVTQSVSKFVLMKSDNIALEIEIDGIPTCLARWAYQGQAADLIRALKYGRTTSVVTELADALDEIAPPADIISWVPATPSRRRQRGFDQGEMLARALARRRGVKARKTLRRIDEVAQTSRDLAGRREGPRFACTARPHLYRLRLLLIDDVVTTGSTLAAAARALNQRGIENLSAAVVAMVVTKVGTQSSAGRSTL